MLKVLVIGETCIDRFIYCDVNKISPEAPVPVLNPVEVIENDGMSGNVVRNIKSMNKNVEITHWYQLEKITKTRFVEKKSNHMFLRLDEGEENISNFKLTKNKISSLSSFDIVVVSDYYKGFLSNDDLIEIGKGSKISILDSKRKLSKEIITSFSFVKLNELEASQNLELINSYNIIITLGSKGSKFLNKIYPSSNPQETIDVSGAGDTFTSAFILKYIETGDIEKSIIYANDMSCIVVSKRGVATP